jgi:hypothetical protein
MTTLRAGDFATQDLLYSRSVHTSTCSTRPNSIDEEKRDLRVEDEGLPPIDGGRQAWAFLAAAFFVEAMCSGRPAPVVLTPCVDRPSGYISSFGVFQHYYHAHPLYAGDNKVAIIVTLASVGSYFPRAK